MMAIMMRAAVMSRIPVLGWYLSHAKENEIRKSGVHTITAPIRTKLLSYDLMNPPTMGMEPVISTIGLKNK
jgi:hypothetical protein